MQKKNRSNFSMPVACKSQLWRLGALIDWRPCEIRQDAPVQDTRHAAVPEIKGIARKALI